MTSLRIFFFGGVLSYRALFNWIRPSIYIPTMLGAPLFQILFFSYLGRYSGAADNAYFVVGNAVQISAMAGVFGMVMSLANERELGTLSAILATPANRFAMFAGRALPVIANGLLISAFGFAAGWLLLGFRMPWSAVPAVAAVLALTATSCAMFGMALGTIAMRVRDVWVSSNLAYYLLLLLCGVNVPLSAMPRWLADIGSAMPLTHGIQAARQIAAGGGLAGASGLIGREALIGLAYAALAYTLLRFFEAGSRKRASLDLL